MDDLVKALVCEGISKSHVSRICSEFDELVDSFLGRPLDGGLAGVRMAGLAGSAYAEDEGVRQDSPRECGSGDCCQRRVQASDRRHGRGDQMKIRV